MKVEAAIMLLETALNETENHQTKATETLLEGRARIKEAIKKFYKVRDADARERQPISEEQHVDGRSGLDSASEEQKV